ncbi:MAG: 2-phosphosulfolactate phosphatase [Anaerolineales bacterium]|nr:2-phosphosulfolactate phosphatase [Anaerolineales bacterium]
MKFHQTTLETCPDATGTVVAIDVVRAFTTAAYAFAAGASEIILTGTVEEALALRRQFPDTLVMGEVDGLSISEFDFGNSPTQIAALDLTGRRLVQRTTAGTQGVVRSTKADLLLAGSLVCAGATVRYLRQVQPETVTFVITGILLGRDGDEDIACADYIAALLRDEQPDITPFVRRVYESTTGRLFTDPAHPEFPAADLACCVEVDRFDFAMVVERREGLWLLKPVSA